MKIGLTYDLREDYLAQGYSLAETAELDSPATVDGLEAAIRAMGHEVERIGGLAPLAGALAAGRRWDLVFNIAEGMHGFGREAAVPALLEAWGIPCTFSDPLVLALALHKGMTKRVVRDCGLRTPDFAVIERLEDVDRVALPYPLFAKPVAEGTSKGVTGNSLVLEPSGLVPVCAELLKTFAQPVLVEEYLPGREFTVGLLGSGERARSVGVMEVFVVGGADTGAYTFDNKAEYESRIRYELADDAPARAAAELALASWRALGCRDGGRVDVRLDAAGQPAFIEVNPLPGLNPSHSDLPIMWALAGKPYGALIAAIVDSACERLPQGGPRP
ncbi:D-alanine--D-alanine ligase family protein [Desulfocurvus vexinensis]|uniref:D-alanine--D-alanine ligase family protein n=1 Tax=Desulfocurvus vexinensis TaxID=399548 RepID=UPI00048B9D2A|nr:D-alanine--D-alanine ligase [Desulfocurvus vexinensis]